MKRAAIAIILLATSVYPANGKSEKHRHTYDEPRRGEPGHYPVERVPGTATYCTTNAESEPLIFKNPDGLGVMNVGKICINFDENVTKNPTEPVHTLTTNLTTNVTFINHKVDMFSIYQQFYQKASPSTPLTNVSLGSDVVQCHGTPFPYTLQNKITYQTLVTVLDKAADKGMLNIYFKASGC